MVIFSLLNTFPELDILYELLLALFSVVLDLLPIPLSLFFGLPVNLPSAFLFDHLLHALLFRLFEAVFLQLQIPDIFLNLESSLDLVLLLFVPAHELIIVFLHLLDICQFLSALFFFGTALSLHLFLQFILHALLVVTDPLFGFILLPVEGFHVVHDDLVPVVFALLDAYDLITDVLNGTRALGSC